MRFVSYLQEEYLNRVFNREVFVNPDRKELASIKDKIRFFVSFSKKKLIVWSAEILHINMLLNNPEVQKILGIHGGEDWENSLPDIFSAYGEYKAGKITNLYSDGIWVYAKYYDHYKKMDSKWTIRWFTKPLTELIVDLSRSEASHLISTPSVKSSSGSQFMPWIGLTSNSE